MLTVLLATRNRSKILRATLESFCELRAPDSGWKLIVVDNGSSDQTPETVKEFSDRLPLQFLTEPRRGKNFALNTALPHIDGDLTVLTDDDVRPRPDWLLKFRHAADVHAEFSIFGGSILPHWEVPPPPWIKWVRQGAAYAVTDPAWAEGPIAASSVWGPNTAIRSAVFKAGIDFNSQIGPSGNNYAQGGDTELTRRLESLGHRAWHVHDAIVEHFVREEQLDLTWVMRRAIRHGRGEFRLGQINELTSRRILFGAPRYLYKQLVREALSVAVAWLSRNEGDLLQSRWRLNFIRGQIQEARVAFKEGRIKGDLSR
jgi:glycosyltransferase involved in cell wall biosynthesis